MKIVLQRVSSASVSVDNTIIGEINKGYLLLVGVTHDDDKKTVDRLIEKISKLRIFPDDNDKINLSIKDVCGEVLVVSQFTLYADCKKGNRPSFINSAQPDLANELYLYLIDKCREYFPVVESGEFGADMAVSLVNDGPFTLLLE